MFDNSKQLIIFNEIKPKYYQIFFKYFQKFIVIVYFII